MIPQLPADWLKFLHAETQKSYYQQLLTRLQHEYDQETIFPPPTQLFRAFELCPLEDVKVVVVGQDPYHAAGQAHGLCFSVNKGVKIPASLRNIFKELAADVSQYRPPLHGDLSQWALQGVLLLNTVLSVRAGDPGSHRNIGWERFSDAVISALVEHKPHLVFMLWGNQAREKTKLINGRQHLVLEAAHPSPLARGAFSGCRHFSRCNEWLENHQMRPIEW